MTFPAEMVRVRGVIPASPGCRRDESGCGGRVGSLAVAAAMALANAGPAAEAAPIELYLEGTILSETSPAGDLAGQPITGRFVFDTDLAPEDSFTAADDPRLLSEYGGDYIRNPVTEFQWIASNFRVGADGHRLRDLASLGGAVPVVGPPRPDLTLTCAKCRPHCYATLINGVLAAWRRLPI